MQQLLRRLDKAFTAFFRRLKAGEKPGFPRFKGRNSKWYICLMLETPDLPAAQHSGPAVGIDMGLHSLLALSDGTLVENPRWLRRSLAQLRVAQRRLSRRKKGSNRRRKAAYQVARLHERIANQRRDGESGHPARC